MHLQQLELCRKYPHKHLDNITHGQDSRGVSLESSTLNGIKREPHGMFHSRGYRTNVQMLLSAIKPQSVLGRAVTRPVGWHMTPVGVKAWSHAHEILTTLAQTHPDSCTPPSLVAIAGAHTHLGLSSSGHTLLWPGLSFLQKRKLRHIETK